MTLYGSSRPLKVKVYYPFVDMSVNEEILDEKIAQVRKAGLEPAWKFVGKQTMLIGLEVKNVNAS